MSLWRTLSCILVLASHAATAAFGDAPLDARGVAAATARGAVVWDVRSAAQYEAEHLPGAVNVGHVSEVLLDPKTQLFAPAEAIAARLGGAGIDPKREIVVYGGPGSAYAYFAQWALESFGARRVQVFHDGVEGWRRAGRAASRQAHRRRPVAVRLSAGPSLGVTADEVIARIGRSDVQFLDVRRLGEFQGKESETLHGGHIPGAIHIPYNMQLADPDAPRKRVAKETADASGMALKDAPALRALYGGLDPGKQTIVYCHTGIRAAMTAAVLKRLGFRDVRLYHGSWFEYGNIPGAPVR